MNHAVLAGLVFGMLGSLHCVGMCGPIMLALPLQEKSKITGLLLYHSGRVFCYGFLGVLLGALGVSLRYTGLHEILSISVGVIMLLTLILYYFNISYLNNSKCKSWLLSKIKLFWKKFFETKSILFLPIIGFLNGLLPCGFVYIALGFALIFSSPIDTLIYMLSFGLGTVPALLGVSYFSQFISVHWRQKIQSLVPFGIFLVGCLLIVRGLSLDIPYLSPVLKGLGCANCH